jgi:hypothetical protein
MKLKEALVKFVSCIIQCSLRSLYITQCSLTVYHAVESVQSCCILHSAVCAVLLYIMQCSLRSLTVYHAVQSAQSYCISRCAVLLYIMQCSLYSLTVYHAVQSAQSYCISRCAVSQSIHTIHTPYFSFCADKTRNNSCLMHYAVFDVALLSTGVSWTSRSSSTTNTHKFIANKDKRKCFTVFTPKDKQRFSHVAFEAVAAGTL